MQTIIGLSKDEVLFFAGIREITRTYYSNKSVTNKLSSIAQKVLRRSMGYGKCDVQSLVVLLSDQQIFQKGVRHIFIADDFFEKKSIEDLYADSMQPVLAFFILYMESHWEEMDKIMSEQNMDCSRSERYWKILLAVVNDFWNAIGHPLNEVLNLPSDFQYDFLWEEEEYDVENSMETVVTAVRKAMPNILATAKTESTSTDTFIYDEKDIWISTDLFGEIMNDSGLSVQKEQLLLECKTEGFLKTNSCGGYTTRLQIHKTRREYYRFERERFNGIGQVEIISLSKGGV